MAVKFFAWLLTNSNAILSDALESIINVAAGAMALYSMQTAVRPPDRKHPYGHGKIAFLSAGFEGALIFLAGVFIIGKAIYNLLDPNSLMQLSWGMILVGISGMINLIMGLLLVKNGRRDQSFIMEVSGKHLLTDAWTSAALIIGLAGVAWTGLGWLDNVVTLVFGSLILIAGFRILRKAVAGMMDEANPALLQQVVSILEFYRRPEWIDVHNLRIIQYGAHWHLDGHLTLPWYFTVEQANAEVNSLTALLDQHADSPIELFVHIDPCRPPHACAICQIKNCPVRWRTHDQYVTWTTENVLEDKAHYA